jgi:hypothetical protein
VCNPHASPSDCASGICRSDTKTCASLCFEDANCPRGPGKTALCPVCGIDAVLPDSIEYEITEKLLKAMQEKYFKQIVLDDQD